MLRRRQGEVLEARGFGPEPRPSRVALRLSGARLLAYGGEAQAAIVLIVPAPIKRAYIWDLAPSVSVIRRCLSCGLRTYLLEWTEPEPEASLGLADYADRIPLACLDAVGLETGAERAVLMGHSLGGTLAAIFASLHPERVQGLVLLEAPTKFGKDAGPFAPLVAMVPAAAVMRAAFDPVPGTFLDLVSITASPWSFLGARWFDRVMSIGNPQAVTTLLRVERWALDEFAMPGHLFQAVVEELYREDRLLGGTLRIGGRLASPASLVMPLLGVVRPSSLIIPPQSVLPLHDLAPSRRQLVLRYDGDRGVSLQHVGVLVGETAHRRIWPAILRWIEDMVLAQPVRPRPHRA